MASGLIILWQIDGETMETVRDFILGAPKSLQVVTSAMKLKDSCPLEEKDDKPRQCIKKQINHFVDKHHCSKSCGFSSSNVCM